MPFIARTKGSKELGWQTYERAVKLMPELREVELEYLSIRDYYINLCARKAQYEEALGQAKAGNDHDHVRELKQKIQQVDSVLGDYRQRSRSAAEGSWAEAFFLCAQSMLPEEVRKAISDEADKLIGRPRSEISR